MTKDVALETYFKESASWDADRKAMNERSVRVAWRVTVGACALTVMAIAAIVILMPLKRTDLVVVRVNDTTGVVDIVPFYKGAANMQELVTRAFLSRYVIACERFNYATAEMDYTECGSFNAPVRAQEWSALWDRSNPKSPLNVFKDGTTVNVDINTVTFFQRGNGVGDLVQIRFTKRQRAGGSGSERLSQWIATLQYAYDTPPKDDRLRSFNPFGLKVIDYHTEPEVRPATDRPSSASTPDAQAAPATGAL